MLFSTATHMRMPLVVCVYSVAHVHGAGVGSNNAAARPCDGTLAAPPQGGLVRSVLFRHRIWHGIQRVLAGMMCKCGVCHTCSILISLSTWRRQFDCGPCMVHATVQALDRWYGGPHHVYAVHHGGNAKQVVVSGMHSHRNGIATRAVTGLHLLLIYRRSCSRNEGRSAAVVGVLVLPAIFRGPACGVSQRAPRLDQAPAIIRVRHGGLSSDW